MYYSRMRFTTQLLPLLLESSLPARVISVFAAGTESKLFLDDLSLREPSRYGYFQARSHITYMKTVFFESLAAKYPGKLSLTHLFPGLVMTPAFKDPAAPAWFKAAWFIVSPVMRFSAVPADEIGARVLFLATDRFPARQSEKSLGSDANAATGTDGNLSSGAYSVGEKSETIPVSSAYKHVDKEVLLKRGWDHTMKAFADIEAGRKFRD